MPHADGSHSVWNDSVCKITPMNMVACDKTSLAVLIFFLDQGIVFHTKRISSSEG